MQGRLRSSGELFCKLGDVTGLSRGLWSYQGEVTRSLHLDMGIVDIGCQANCAVTPGATRCIWPMASTANTHTKLNSLRKEFELTRRVFYHSNAAALLSYFVRRDIEGLHIPVATGFTLVPVAHAFWALGPNLVFSAHSSGFTGRWVPGSGL